MGQVSRMNEGIKCLVMLNNLILAFAALIAGKIRDPYYEPS